MTAFSEWIMCFDLFWKRLTDSFMVESENINEHVEFEQLLSFFKLQGFCWDFIS